jgi:CubicO group peptidase (beta-lactamase class C family)
VLGLPASFPASPLEAQATATARALAPGFAVQETGFSSERLARIGAVLREYVEQGRMAGAVGLILRHGTVVWQEATGWSDREAGRRMTPDALFRIASQSKAITSVAVMMLVEEGRIALTDPVSRYLPAYAKTTVAVAADSGRAIVPARTPITIRQLLTHTAGISYGTTANVSDLYARAGLGPAAGWGWYTADKTEPVCATMDRLASLPFVAQPGEAYVYGYNTDILGCLVEKVSGMTLDAFLRARIFEPLGMKDTHFFVPPGKRDRLTAVYASVDGRLVRAPDGPRGQGDYVDGPRTSYSGGAGLVSTAADYARFLQMLLNGGALDGVRLLSPKTVALMTADHVDSVYGQRGAGFGLGFEVLEDPGLAGRYGTAGSFGWGGAYHSTYRVDPAEGLVMVLLTQTLPAGALDLTTKFYTLVYQALVR